MGVAKRDGSAAGEAHGCKECRIGPSNGICSGSDDEAHAAKVALWDEPNSQLG